MIPVLGQKLSSNGHIIDVVGAKVGNEAMIGRTIVREREDGNS